MRRNLSLEMRFDVVSALNIENLNVNSVILRCNKRRLITLRQGHEQAILNSIEVWNFAGLTGGQIEVYY